MPTEAEMQAQVIGQFLKELTDAQRSRYFVVVTTRTGKQYGGYVESLSSAVVGLRYERTRYISISLFVIESVEVRT